MLGRYLNTFKKAIEDYLLSVCTLREIVSRLIKPVNNHNFTLYTETGVSLLKIKPNTYIDIIYFDNTDKPLINLNEYDDFTNVAVFLNVERKRVAFEKKTNVTVFCIDDLEPFLGIKDHDRFSSDVSEKNNCISNRELESFLKFSIRVNILSSLFANSVITPFVYDAGKDKGFNIFPFIYYNGFEKYILFEDKRTLLKFDISSSQNEFESYIQISFNRTETEQEAIGFTATFKKTISFEKRNVGGESIRCIFRKLIIDNLNTYISLFNRGSRYYVDDFFPLFKYRQFEKTRYPSEENTMYVGPPLLYPEGEKICVGSRTAIENDTIWFSTYDCLNDPFDLRVRVPKKFKKKTTIVDTFYHAVEYKNITKSYLTVFCTTRTDDNILMWSHYGDSHKGMCSMYLQNELLDSISRDKTVGICIYGKVEYSRDRPEFTITATTLRFLSLDVAILWFNIRNIFSKYVDWEYENEYRFILIPTVSAADTYSKGHGEILKARNFKFGYNFPTSSFSKYLSHFGIRPKLFQLSDYKYKLI